MRKYLDSGTPFFVWFLMTCTYALSFANRDLEKKMKTLEKRTNRAILAVLKEKVGINFIQFGKTNAKSIHSHMMEILIQIANQAAEEDA